MFKLIKNMCQKYRENPKRLLNIKSNYHLKKKRKKKENKSKSLSFK